MVLYEIFHTLTSETKNTFVSDLRNHLFIIVEAKAELGLFPMIIEVFILNDLVYICIVVIRRVTGNLTKIKFKKNIFYSV